MMSFQDRKVNLQILETFTLFYDKALYLNLLENQV